MMEPQEIQALTTQFQMHDPRRGLLPFQPEFGQQFPLPHQRGFGLLTSPTHHDGVVGETDQHPMLTHIPHPIDPMQEHVAHR